MTRKSMSLDAIGAGRPILVTGVGGQVGFELLRTLQALGTVIAVDRARLDLSDLDAVRRFVRDLQPSMIVNPAAYTAVDLAETNVAASMRLNAETPGVLAEEAARCGAALIHYSTDYVFDGAKQGAYVEDDATNPQNVYGRSKLAGEQAIAAVGCPHVILRTSWVYGRRGKNFLLTMLKLGAERPELRVVADQVGAPTWANTIAAATAHIVAQGLAAGSIDWWQRRSGVYHLTCGGETSWFGFARAIFESSASSHVAPTLVPIPAAEYPVPAKRPANSVLSNEKLQRVFGLRLPAWDEALQLCLQS